MKALPKRKGNSRVGRWEVKSIGLNESPNKKGKWVGYLSTRKSFSGLNEILHLKVQNKRSSSRPGGRHNSLSS